MIPSLSAALVGCATPNAPEYGGRWRPVNRFPEAPLEIALHQSYRFYASPLDGTLKTMLERWAGDSKMKLDYQAPVDYTLHAPVADIRADDINDAVSRLSKIYSAQHVAVSVEGNRIKVRLAAAPASPVAP
ncbi:MAG TPA: TcpQ domain-containing protein [Lysobacter sp.]